MAYENAEKKRRLNSVPNPPKTTTLSHAQIKEVPCVTCGASVGESCREANIPSAIIGGFHANRVQLREKLPAFNDDMQELGPSEKSLIAYYAFVLLCDSASAHSRQLFNGKDFDSATIQRFFAQKAIQELRRYKLLT